MPLKKILFRPGVNRENTRYAAEVIGSVTTGTAVVGGWYESDKVRFRQGTPEKLGGWTPFSSETYLGVCRSLWDWTTLDGTNLIGVGTNLKFYINRGGYYYDVTPIRSTVVLNNPFTASNGSYIIYVNAVAHGCSTGDYVTFSGAVSLGQYITAAVLDQEYSITVIDVDNYTITSTIAAGPLDIGHGGASVTAAYQVSIGDSIQIPSVGWGAGPYGAGSWGVGQSTVSGLRIWGQNNFGEDLVYGPRNGGIYYWAYDAGVGLNNRGVNINTLGGNITIGSPGSSVTLNNPFTATNGSKKIAVFSASHGLSTGDAVTYSGATSLGQYITSDVLNQTYSVTVVDGSNYTITTTIAAGPSDTGKGGAAVVANAFSPTTVTLTNALAVGTGVQIASTGTLPTGLSTGVTYYIENVVGLTCYLSATRGGTGITVSSAYTGTAYISLLTDAPIIQSNLFISDTSRFVFAFGANPLDSAVQDPMLVRWSDQESFLNWTPAVTNQAGSIRLSHGSTIIAALQTRQEIVVFTDSSVYSFQYVGAPIVWSNQLLGDNISIIGPNSAVLASSVTYWMGVDKFYMYDGRVQTLNCDLRRFIFNDINLNQRQQVFAGTNEGFNEVWWFYCSQNSDVVDRYVIYNYQEKVWYYGTMNRTAWLDSGLQSYPIAATYSNNLVYHESGLDDNVDGTALPIEAYISSAEFDIDDGHNFGFIWRVLPDLTFEGSDMDSPELTVTMYGLENSGSGANLTTSGRVISSNTITVTEEFTGQINTRIRGRQLIFKVASDKLGTAWQCGAMRIDIRADGRR